MRRPLLVAFVLGCAVSLMTSGRLTLRLAAPATVYWSFIPLLGIAGLALVARRRMSARLVDEFFAGYLPWVLWLTAFSGVWAFLPPVDAFGHSGYPFVWELAAVVAAAWAGFLDFRFSRRMLQRTTRGALVDVLLQRLIGWTGALAIFVWPAATQVLASRLGL